MLILRLYVNFEAVSRSYYRQCPNGGFFRPNAVPNFQCFGECAPLRCGPTTVPDEHLAVSATGHRQACTCAVQVLNLECQQPSNQSVYWFLFWHQLYICA